MLLHAIFTHLPSVQPANSELYHIIWASYVLEKPEDTIAKLFERLIAPVEVEDFKQLSAGLSMLKASFPDKIINNPGFLAIVSKVSDISPSPLAPSHSSPDKN